MNPSASQELADFQGLNGLVEGSILLRMLQVRAEPPFSSLRNLIPVLLDITDYALTEDWSVKGEWQHHRTELATIGAVLEQNPLLYPLQAPSSIDGNSLGGQIRQFPVLALLLQSANPVELRPLSTMLKAAVVNRILRGNGLKPQFVHHLRRALAGKNTFLNPVLNRGLTLSDWSRFWREVRRESGDHHSVAGIDKDRRNFLEALLELSNVGIEPTTDYHWSRIGPQTGVGDADSPEPPVMAVASTIEDPSADDAPPPLLVEYTNLDDLLVPARDTVEAAVRAQAAKSSYWLATVDEFVPEAWSSLTGVERKYLVDTLKRLLEEAPIDASSAGSKLVLLSLITGQPIERVARFTYGSEGDVTSSGDYHRHIPPPPSAYQPPEDLASLLHKPTDSFNLCLPDIGISVLPSSSAAMTNTPLHEAFGLSYEKIIEQAKGFLEAHRLATGYRLSAHRVRMALRHQLILQGRGKYVIHLITSAENDAPPIDAYYVAISPERLEQYYRKAVEALLA